MEGRRKGGLWWGKQGKNGPLTKIRTVDSKSAWRGDIKGSENWKKRQENRSGGRYRNLCGFLSGGSWGKYRTGRMKLKSCSLRFRKRKRMGGFGGGGNVKESKGESRSRPTKVIIRGKRGPRATKSEKRSVRVYNNKEEGTI